jgi:aminopeptidase N
MDPIQTVLLDNGDRVVSFAETPLMSTYLFAVAIGDFKKIESVLNNEITARVFVTNGTDPYEGAFALMITGCYLLPLIHIS